jgi:hypothetical protein
MSKSIDLYETLINRQEYFDGSSSSFARSSFDKKLLDIALYLKKGGDLHYLISRYKNNRSIVYLSSLKDTLIHYICYLREHKAVTAMNLILFEYFSESQLITILTLELSKRLYADYNPNNSINQHVEYKINIGGYKMEKYLIENAAPVENRKRIALGDLYGKIDIDKEERQNLIYENPWLRLTDSVKDNDYKPLKENIHPEDEKYIHEFNSLVKGQYRYNLRILPEPFWGNVLDAKVIILTLNPGFVPKKNIDEFECLNENEQKDFIKDQCEYMSLSAKQFIPNNINRNSISDFYWDKKTKKLRNHFPDANRKIALIQYIAYTSEKFKDIPKKISKQIYDLKDGPLETQQFALRLVRYSIQENKVIIIARGKKLWCKAIPELEKYQQLIILNNYRNTTISEGNCTKSKKFHLIEDALK